MIKFLAIAFALITSQFIVQAQSADDEVKRLKLLVKENEERALKAEAAAAQYFSRASNSEKEAVRCRYVSTAILLTYQINEQMNKELALLLAVQAYNYSAKYGMDPSNANIHKALLTALGKFDSAPQNLSNKELAAKLCGLAKRNMTKEEWDFYIGTDLTYEHTCS